MPGTDNVVFNTLERPLSTDQTNLQSLLGRTVLNLLRYGLSLRYIGIAGDAVRSIVLGGLTVTPNGSDVSVAAGALLQYSATLAPAPGTYDSPYREATNLISTTVVMPAPGGTVYYLIEAQMTEVTTVTESRDVLDPGTGTFIPTAVPKIRERQIQFQLLTGGASAPAPTGGDWVPIAIVRRPGGGPAVVADDIIDVRPLSDFGRERPTMPVLLKDRVTTPATTANTAIIQTQADGLGGVRQFEVVTGNVDLSSATYLSPSVVLAASTRYYLYLAPWSALELNPRQLASGGLTTSFEGVLVLSDVAPTALGRNSAVLDLPAPYAVMQPAAASAYYIGTLFRNSANTAWTTSVRLNGHTKLASAQASQFDASFAPPGGTNSVPINTAPVRSRMVTLRILYTGAGAANTVALSIINAATTQLASAIVYDNATTLVEVEVPYEGDATLDIATTGLINAGSTMLVAVIGWQE